MKQKMLGALGVVMAFGLLTYYAVVSSPQPAEANRSQLSVCTLEGDGTANDYYATNSLRYMSAGAATTTLTCNTGGTDQVNLMITQKASSTASTLGWWIEYSRNGVDWYAAQTDFDPGVATSSQQMVSNYTKHLWKYASSTAEESQGKADTAFTNVLVKNIGAPYMRVKFFVPVGALNTSFQVEMLRKIQRL